MFARFCCIVPRTAFVLLVFLIGFVLVLLLVVVLLLLMVLLHHLMLLFAIVLLLLFNSVGRCCIHIPIGAVAGPTPGEVSTAPEIERHGLRY